MSESEDYNWFDWCDEELLSDDDFETFDPIDGMFLRRHRRQPRKTAREVFAGYERRANEASKD